MSCTGWGSEEVENTLGKTFGQTLVLVHLFFFFLRLSSATHFHSSLAESGACGRGAVWLLDSAYLIKVEQDLSAVQLVSLQANSLVHQQLLGNTQGEKKKKRRSASRKTDEGICAGGLRAGSCK